MNVIDTKGQPIIFYGAGNEAQFEVAKYRVKGIIPTCFCDQNAAKWGKPFLGFECISLEQAIEKYPDFMMVVTPRFPLRFRIMDDLLARKIVSKEQIINYEPYVKMKSCPSLHSILDANAAKVLAICCGQIENSRRPQIRFDGDLMGNIQKMKQYRKDILENLNASSSVENFSACDNCRWASVDYWPVDTRIRTVKYDFGGRCQFNCLYCFSPARNNMVEAEWAKSARLPAFLAGLEQAGLLHPDVVIEYAAGEICVAPNQDEIFDALEQYTSIIITNAGNYSPRLAKLIAEGKVKGMLVSLDAGTAATFQTIKGGAGVLAQVKSNLAEYIRLGAPVDLKYIFMDGVNDNIEDVDGFVALAKELGVARICISKDHRKGVVSSPEHILALMERMASNARRHGLEVVPASGFFTDDEMKQLGLASPAR